jgi:hypothetical protein
MEPPTMKNILFIVTLTLFGLLAPRPGQAFTARLAGPYATADIGTCTFTPDFSFQPCFSAHLGGWFGLYDKLFLLGKANWLGVLYEQGGFAQPDYRSARVEYRRQQDVLSASGHYTFNMGPEWVDSQVGFAASGGVGVRFRMTLPVAVAVQLQLGAGSAGGWHPIAGIFLGFEGAFPVTKIEE